MASVIFITNMEQSSTCFQECVVLNFSLLIAIIYDRIMLEKNKTLVRRGLKNPRNKGKSKIIYSGFIR